MASPSRRAWDLWDVQASLERLAALAPEVIVHPGHGPATSIGVELATNPFLSGAARVLGA